MRARLAVDTGGGGFIALLSKSFVEKHGLMSQVLKSVPEPRFGYAGQQPRVRAARIEKLTLGPFGLQKPVVLFWQVPGFGGGVEPDGLLCGDFFRRFKVIFDWPRSQLILEPNARFSDDPPFDASGARVYRQGQAPYRIYKVIEDSPASEAGLREGDVLLTANGKP